MGTSLEKERSYKELLKRYYKGERAKLAFIEFVTQIVTDLSSNPFLDSSFAEAIPGGLRLPEGWEFRKYYFDMRNVSAINLTASQQFVGLIVNKYFFIF